MPLHLHYKVAFDCLSAGCDVFLEKTMCYTVAEAKKLAAQVTASKRVFQVWLQRRANAIYKQPQAMVAAGMIGQVISIKAQWHRWRGRAAGMQPMLTLPSSPQARHLSCRTIRGRIAARRLKLILPKATTHATNWFRSLTTCGDKIRKRFAMCMWDWRIALRF
ncbi:MAG: Gfo/Idh/MocA family protein [Blastocatellia bacterium]